MVKTALETLLFCAGLFLICLVLSEDFRQGLQRLQALLRRRPRLRYLAYPLGVLLLFGAAALIVNSLTAFASTRFSYD